jgi:AcrR family transcriptional regulator
MPEARARSRDRRGEIRGHAAKLFRNQGYHATTMDDIAEAVQLNKGTLYHYYESKANVLFEILLDTHDRRLNRIRSRPKDLDHEERVTAFVEETIMDLADHPIDGAVLFQEAPFVHLWLTRDQVQVLRARQAEFDRYIMQAVREGQEAGTFDASLDARVVTNALVAIVSWFIRWYKPGGRLDSREVAKQSCMLLLHGMLSPADGRPAP